MPRDVKTFNRDVFIFDMDGTLIDSMHLWDEAIRNASAQLGVTLPDGFYSEIKTYTSDQVYAFLQDQHGMSATPQEYLDQMEAQITALYRTVDAKPHAAELLEAYRAKGEVVLLTNSARHLFTPLLTRLELLHYFSATWSCREAGGSKHTATPFLRVLEELNATPADALLFEDSFSYVSVAKELGIATVGVFDPLSAKDEAAFRTQADLYIRDLDELFV